MASGDSQHLDVHTVFGGNTDTITDPHELRHGPLLQLRLQCHHDLVCKSRPPRLVWTPGGSMTLGYCGGLKENGPQVQKNHI